MEPSDLVLAILDSAKEPVRGRTAIQKMAYFVSVQDPGVRAELDFVPHFYGPYSSRVASALQDLVQLGAIDEIPSMTEGGNPVYTYSITADGKHLAQSIKENLPSLQTVSQVVSKCQAAHKNVNILSWAAKTHFLLSLQNRPVTIRQATEIGKDYGWEMSSEEARVGIGLLKELGLVVQQ